MTEGFLLGEEPLCGHCHQRIIDHSPESCWWCQDDLCYGCWDRIGHCGHPEAEAINEQGRRMGTP